MKLKNILCGILVCGAFCACSDQESENSNKPRSFDGKAYLRVNITDANSTRATGGDLEYGDATEHEVVNADFFFYDTNGIFIARANVWDSGTENEDNPAGNIEFFGKSVIVLKGLTETNHPKHLVTVLNTPEDFEPANTLDEMKTLLAGSIYNGSHFTMSTTSYGRTSAAVPYFVTEVSESDFKKELDEAQNATPVDIYVERLAAKVTLRVDNDQLVPVEGKPGIYKIKVTVAGDPNKQEQGTQTGAADIYVRFLGWGLNATAKDSYIVKNIETTWSDTDLGFAWNDAVRFRSYWGKSYNYGKQDGKYPDVSAEAAVAEYLNYINADNLTKQFGQSAYCAENSNTSEIVSEYLHSAVTSILLKAQILDENEQPLEMIRYNGTLYKRNDYLNYVLNTLQKGNKLNLYCLEDEATGKYVQIDHNCVELANDRDGKVYLKLKPLAAGTSLYRKSGETYAPASDTELGEVEKNMKDFNAYNEAIGYKDGLMYYNIPIEHLNNAATTTDAENKRVIPVAKYGIVRNHHYVVTVNSLTKIGKGIFDPEEEIVPGKNDEKDTYYVGARINILSWKIVNQNVNL